MISPLVFVCHKRRPAGSRQNFREAAGFEASGVVTRSGVYWGVAASLIWAIVIITGRLTAYLGTLYSGSGG